MKEDIFKNVKFDAPVYTLRFSFLKRWLPEIVNCPLDCTLWLYKKDSLLKLARYKGLIHPDFIYVRRVFLEQTMKQDQTSSIVAYSGERQYSGDLNMFFEVASCGSKCRIHIGEQESVDTYLGRLQVMRDELDAYILAMQNNLRLLNSKNE